MLIWYVVVFALFVFSVLEVLQLYKIKIVEEKFNLVKYDLKLHGMVYIFIAMVLGFLSAFRFETGRDWNSYLDFFSNPEFYLEEQIIERGYLWFNILFNSFGVSYWVMQAFFLVFCSYVLFGFFYKQSSYPLYTLTIYYCLYYFSNDLAQTRQYLAMSILILGLRFIEKKKLLYWVLTVIIAMQFHVTALVAFPIYFILRIKIKPWFAFVMLVITLLLNLFGLKLIWALVELILKMQFLPERIHTILQFYIDIGIYSRQTQFSTGLGFFVWYSFYFYVIFLYYLKYRNSYIQESYVLCFLIYVLFLALGRNFSAFGRIGIYYCLCGGGIFVYNIMIDSKLFSDKLNLLKLVPSIGWLMFLMYDFFKQWSDAYEYTYRCFLFS